MGATKAFAHSLISLSLHVRNIPTRIFLLCSAVCVIVLVAFTSQRPLRGTQSERKLSGESCCEKVVVRDCVFRTPGSVGRTFEAKVKGVNVSFAAWTPNESFDKEVVSLRTHEAVRIMSRLGRAGTLLDVGANIGKVTFPTLALPETHTVVAVEPVSVNVNQLCMTGNLNGWLGHSGFLLLHAAMSETVGEMEIYVPRGREDNAALNAQAATANVGNMGQNERVRLVVGDDVISELGFKPDLIKIDTQGHELHVLRGLRKYLGTSEAGNVLVMAESDPKLMRMSGVDPADIYELMVTELGYTAYCRPEIDAEDGKFVVTGAALTRNEYPPGGCRDIFYIKQSRRQKNVFNRIGRK